MQSYKCRIFLTMQIIYYILGWIYVLIRFRSISKGRKFVQENYNGLYGAVCVDLMLNAFALLGATFMIIMVIITICKILYGLFTGTLGPS